MHVAIAIVSFRSAEDLVGCLAALGASTFTDFEVIVCENGGAQAFADLTASLPARLPGGQTVRAILAGGNVGYAAGCNLCIRAAPNAEAWWILNPDTQPSSGALAALVDRMAVGDCDAVGGTLQLPNGTVQSHGGRWRTGFARAVSLGYGRPISEAVDASLVERRQNYLSGASMLVGRRFWETAGPMREDYFLYCEEVEWCLRAIELGLRLGFAPEAVVLHQGGASTGNSTDVRRQARTPVFLNERNRLLLTRDRFPGALPMAVVAAFLLIFLRFARRGAWNQMGYAMAGWRAGLADERGPPDWIVA